MLKEDRNKNVVTTHKIEVRVAGSLEERNKNWKRLREIDSMVYRAFNDAMSSCHINFLISSAMKTGELTDKTTFSVDRAQVLSNLLGIDKTSPTTVIYTMLRKKYPLLPSSVVSKINQMVQAHYSADLRNGLNYGSRSLRSYRQGCAIPIGSTSQGLVHFNKTEEGGKSEFTFTWNSILFMTVNSYKDGNNSRYLNAVLVDPSSMCDSTLKVDGKKTYFLMTTNQPRTVMQVDKNKAIGVDLGIAIPVVVATDDGKSYQKIGSREEFGEKRLAIQGAYRKAQKSIIAKSGNGRRSINCVMERFAQKERNFVKTKNHEYSKRIVDFAVKTGSGVIRMEELGFSNPDGDTISSSRKFFLRNWSYYELQQMVVYKANQCGIDVEFIDPHYTSQMCSVCGHVERGNRLTQSEFKCLSCGATMNADVNAAINIANSGNVLRFNNQTKKSVRKTKKEVEASEKAQI